MIVHLLHYGRPACGFSSATPSNWGPDDRWAGLDEFDMVTCPACLATIEIQNAPNTLQAINEIWAVVSVDAIGEGIVAAPLADGMLSVPLIAADMARVHSILPIARAISRKTGTPMRLIKFSTREVIEEIKPG